jgi:hypothetical protein
MKKTILCVLAAAVLLVCGCATRVAEKTAVAADSAGGLVLLDTQLLAKAKRRAADGEPAAVAAVARLRGAADEAMGAGPFTVVNKTALPPSGDRHDYRSLAIYWWPNPDTPDGLPYVCRDGERNPETEQYDGPQLHGMAGAVHTLSLAHHFTGDGRYAGRAALLLRTFFLDEATRMNPNLNFAQGVPGRSTGTPTGIIESVGFATRVVDAALLLRGAKAWTDADERGLQQWFRDYLTWLETSSPGKLEGLTRNNHAMYYDVQTAAFALYTGNAAHARAVLEGAAGRRIDKQVRADGSQPEELRRTKSFHYSVYNLQAMFALAAMGRQLGVDLWGHRGPEGQGIPPALDFLLPYLDPATPWPFKEIKEIDAAESLRPFLQQAVALFGDKKYRPALDRVGTARDGDLMDLLYPR